MAEERRPVVVLGFHALDLGPADRIGERCGRLAQEERLAAVDLRGDDAGAMGELESPRPFRAWPLGEAAGARLVGRFVAGLVEARQGAVRRAGEQPAIAQERRCVVERLERAVRRQAAGVRAAFPKLGEARHALLYSARVATAAIVTIGNELLSGDVVNTN